mmetsp:Transcript_41580/g.120397  ORF Transcript_41580/g.120397 Transcript_41580/m.120397 type:complete len:220 (+) Transcript_41580:2157-2816(+)
MSVGRQLQATGNPAQQADSDARLVRTVQARAERAVRDKVGVCPEALEVYRRRRERHRRAQRRAGAAAVLPRSPDPERRQGPRAGQGGARPAAVGLRRAGPRALRGSLHRHRRLQRRRGGCRRLCGRGAARLPARGRVLASGSAGPRSALQRPPAARVERAAAGAAERPHARVPGRPGGHARCPRAAVHVQQQCWPPGRLAAEGTDPQPRRGLDERLKRT